MSSASNYLENKVLDHVLKVAAYTQPAGLYVGLFLNTSGNAATNLEEGTITDEISTSGTSYARVAVTFGASSGGSSTNSAAVTFAAAGTDWGTVTHIAVMDQATGGNVLFWGQLTASKIIQTADIFQINASNLTITLN